MADTSTPNANAQNPFMPMIFGVSVGFVLLVDTLGVEHLGDSDGFVGLMIALRMVCAVVSIFGAPGIVVSVIASPFIGNMHDPNLYVAAAANAIFYWLLYLWIQKVRARKYT